jgi:hypothetical protein
MEGSVNSTNAGRGVGYNFGQACWTGVEIMGEGFKVIELSANVAVNADAVADPGLECAEKTMVPIWNGKNHAAQFFQSFLPGFEGDMFGAAEFQENGSEAFVSLRRKFESLTYGIDEPAKE